MAVIYAWAVPALVKGSPVDHTWVTDFDNQASSYNSISDVLNAGSDFWFCWGDYHSTGRYLGSQTYDPILASCLVQPNATSQSLAAARGTVFSYGVDGVCHQLANQVLFSTNIGGSAPITVSAARGYWASSFIYGTYGLQNAAWASKSQSCSEPQARLSKAKKPTSKLKLIKRFQGPLDSVGVKEVTDFKDDFESQAQTVLSNEPVLLGRLLTLRGEVRSFVTNKIPGSTLPSADMLNSRNQHFIDEAARLLGPQKFEAIFGARANEKINLVNKAFVPD